MISMRISKSISSFLMTQGILFIVTSATLPKNYAPPKIALLGVHSGGRYGMVYGMGFEPYKLGQVNLTFSNSTVYVVPETVNDITLQCTASYPVSWNLMESNVKSEIIANAYVNTRRLSGDIFDTSTFNYSANLLLQTFGHPEKLTGNYTCESKSFRRTQSSVFLYWEGKKVLVNSMETITVYAESKQLIILPCGVSSPFHGNPSLIRETPNEKIKSIPLTLNESISYSKTKGFILDNLPNPVGQYRCEISKEDYVTVKVKPTNDKKLKSSKSNATFTYNEDTNELKCCSGSKRAPNIIMFHCTHASTCQIREHSILPLHYLISRNKRNGNCVTHKLQFLHSSVARCIGDGIDEYKEYIAPYKSSFWTGNKKADSINPYFNWEEIDPQDMFYIVVNTDSPPQAYNIYQRQLPAHPETKKLIYSKQTISATCATSPYYFSSGVQWAIKWRNGSLTPYTNNNNGNNNNDIMLNERMYNNDWPSTIYNGIVNSEMDALVCFAPVWNSSLWAQKTLYLYVNETVHPNILPSDETTTQTWYLNDTKQSIQCEGSGVPLPKIVWLKGTHVLSNNSHNFHIYETTTGGGNITKENSTLKSILTINRVSHFTSGDFICRVTNYGGSVTKKFTIDVIERKYWGSTIVIIISACIVCGILGTAIYYVVRMKKLASTTATAPFASRPEHLGDTASNNVNAIATDTDVCNATYDNGGMRSQLVEV